MSDVRIGAWEQVLASGIERRLRFAVAAGCALIAGALLYSAFKLGSFALLAVASLSLLASLWAFATLHPRLRRQRQAALRVDSDGAVFVRWRELAPIPVQPIYIYAWFLLLQPAKGSVWVIWPDSLGSEAFRRLIVAARWASQCVGPAKPLKIT